MTALAIELGVRIARAVELLERQPCNCINERGELTRKPKAQCIRCELLAILEPGGNRHGQDR